jgi:hypothetical protein
LKLEMMKQLIEYGDADEVKDLLIRAKVARDHFSDIQSIARTKNVRTKDD